MFCMFSKGTVALLHLLDRLIVALASLYVSRHLNHHCHGEHCLVCHHIHRCLELISLCVELVTAPIEILYRCFLFCLPFVRALSPSHRTLVSQKVLLLN